MPHPEHLTFLPAKSALALRVFPHSEHAKEIAAAEDSDGAKGWQYWDSESRKHAPTPSGLCA